MALSAGLMAFVLTVASLAILATPATAALEGTWVEETPIDLPRAQAVVVESDGLVYVISGVSAIAYDLVANVSTYDLETGEWGSVEPLPLAVKGASGAVGKDGKVYVFGGDSGMGITSVVQIYDPELDSWTYGTNMLVGVWQGRAAVAYNGLIYVFGGLNIAWSNTGAVQIYDPALDSWSYGSSLPAARSGGALATYPGGYAFVYSGGSSSTWTDATTNVWMYYVQYDYWASLSNMPEPLANHAAVFGLDRNMYVMGGGPDGYNTYAAYSSTYRYSYGEDAWYDGPELPIGARNLAALATPEGKVFVIGGNNDTAVLDQVYSLEVAWSELSMPRSSAVRGGYLTLELAFDFAFLEPSNVYIGTYMVSGSGTVYAAWEFYLPGVNSAVVEMSLPESVPLGDYEIVVLYFEVYAGGNYAEFPCPSFAVTVVDGTTLEEMIQELQAAIAELETEANNTEVLEKIAALEDQIAALEDALDAALEQTNTDIGDVQTSVDGKMSAVMGYAIIGLLVVVIVLMLVTMMGRKSAPPPPPSA